jgi:mono/diheme cytochrome c family protein
MDRVIKFCLFLALFAVALPLHSKAATPDVEKGKYLLMAAGCIGCHTTQENFKNGILMSGGRALKTPFGTFNSPNITSDAIHGIGRWTEANFIDALRNGMSPKGEHYLPVFPYTSFTQMKNEDMRHLWAYMKTVPAIQTQNKPHEAPLIFRLRFSLGPWKMINFKAGAFVPQKDKDAIWNRGAYLVNALSHCGECHTPRNIMGGLKSNLHLSGTKDGPDGDAVPNITPHTTGIGGWSDDDLDTLFTIGMLPDGDFVSGGMAEVVENIAKMTSEDRKAVMIYLKSTPSITSNAK